MPVVVACSHCQRLLQVQEAHLGMTVRCPACGRGFAARPPGEAASPPSAGPDFELSSPAPPPPPPPPRVAVAPEPPPSAPGGVVRLRPSADYDGGTYAVELGRESLESARPRRRRRRERIEEEPSGDVRPHRGALILALGIVGLVAACIPIIGWVLGGIAMSMASNDEKLMQARAMDRSGRTMTRAGLICGIVAVFLATVWFIINAALYFKNLSHR